MSNKPTIVEPKFSDDTLSALERNLKAHDLRLRPGQTLEAVAEAFATAGITLEAKFGGLAMSQHNAPIHTSQAFEGLASTQGERFYPRDISTVKSKSEMDVTAKVAFIKTHGEAAFSALPVNTPLQPTELNKAKITSAEYRALPWKTRSELQSHWSADDVRKILGRK